METTRLLKKALSLLIVLIVVLLTCTGCASMLRVDGPYEGKVIDAITKEPIEGAVIHGAWYKVHLGGAHDYYDSYEVLTDKNGNFKIPGKGLLMFSDVEDMTLTIFKAGYKQWTPNSWSGLKEGKWQNEEVIWHGNKGTFSLQRMMMEERRKRIVDFPVSVPPSKYRLLIIERNKEKLEVGSPLNSLLPTE
jgi:hypothetical protein